MLELSNKSASAGLRMRSRIPTAFILTAVIATSAASSLTGAQDAPHDPHRYKFALLNAPFVGVTQTVGYGINDLGMVVGSYNDAVGDHGFVLERGIYTPIDFPLPGAQNTVAFGINNRREIVGSYTAGGVGHGFLFKDGVFTTRDFPAPGVTQTQARGIDDQGRIVGTYIDDAGSHGFLFNLGVFTAVDVPFAGACCTIASGINDRGEIVGSYGGGDGFIHAFVQENGEFRTIDLPFPNNQGLAYAITNRGEIGGTGFILDRGGITLLSALNPNAVNAVALGVNDRGEIVGIVGNLQESSFLLEPE
jgi:probable HAF family extracellular repeat protein